MACAQEAGLDATEPRNSRISCIKGDVHLSMHIKSQRWLETLLSLRIDHLGDLRTVKGRSSSALRLLNKSNEVRSHRARDASLKRAGHPLRLIAPLVVDLSLIKAPAEPTALMASGMVTGIEYTFIHHFGSTGPSRLDSSTASIPLLFGCSDERSLSFCAPRGRVRSLRFDVI